MKYYLGRFIDRKYEPIDCIKTTDEKDKETDILTVMNFTSKFFDEEELRRYLVNENLINGEEPLAYVSKKKNEYTKIKNGDALTFSYAKEYNTGSGLYNTLRKEKYNLELFKFITKTTLEKYQNVKNHLAIRDNVLALYNEVRYANEIGIDKYQETTDKRKLDGLILNFLKSSYGVYDKDKKKYKVTNNKLDVDKRKLADLILLLNCYYNEIIRESFYMYEEENNQEHKDTYEEIEGYDKEEFLTDEDFESHGMNPQDYKRLIRN